MRNYEVFSTEDELIERIDDLRQEGFENNEFQVIVNDELSYEYLDFYQIQDPTRNDLDEIGDRISVVSLLDDPDLLHFDRYDWDSEISEDVRLAVESGEFILVIDRDDYYNDFARTTDLEDPLRLNEDGDDFHDPQVDEFMEIVEPEAMAQEEVENVEMNPDDMEGDDFLE